MPAWEADSRSHCWSNSLPYIEFDIPLPYSQKYVARFYNDSSGMSVFQKLKEKRAASMVFCYGNGNVLTILHRRVWATPGIVASSLGSPPRGTAIWRSCRSSQSRTCFGLEGSGPCCNKRGGGAQRWSRRRQILLQRPVTSNELLRLPGASRADAQRAVQNIPCMTFEIFVAMANFIAVLSVVTPCSLAGESRRFGERVENADTAFRRHFAAYLLDYVTS